MRTLILTLIGSAAALAIAAPLAAAPSSARAAASVTVRASSYGRILFDGRGFVLYAFTADSRGQSNCSGACATAWPPYIVKRSAVAAMGTGKSLLGVAKRRDGSLQLTYAGRPLYYYVGDRKAGQILCQNVSEFGGRWLVLRRSGALVR